MVYSTRTQLSYAPTDCGGKPCWPRSDFFIHTSDVCLELRIHHHRILQETIAYLFANTYLVFDTIYGAVCGYDTVMVLRVDNIQARSLDA